MRDEKPEWYEDPNWAGYLPAVLIFMASISALFFSYIFGIIK